jgi:hypothetical protein
MSRATTTTVCTALYAAALLCGYVGFKWWFYSTLVKTNLAHLRRARVGPWHRVAGSCAAVALGASGGKLRRALAHPQRRAPHNALSVLRKIFRELSYRPAPERLLSVFSFDGAQGEHGDLLVNLLGTEHSKAGDDGKHHLVIDGYGYRWYRVGGLETW